MADGDDAFPTPTTSSLPNALQFRQRGSKFTNIISRSQTSLTSPRQDVRNIQASTSKDPHERHPV